MSTFIKSFQLLNFQSWANDSKEVHLEKDVMNVIEGANETGKSVFYKAMYNMVFPGYWSAQELIRRGFLTAAMLLHLGDGITLIYVLEKAHHSVTLFNDETKNTWEDYKILPDDLIKELGLILDTKNKVILNIIDKDVPLPFIKTTPSFNASLFLSIVEPPEITEFYETLKEQMKESDAARNAFYAAASNKRAAYDVLPYYDADELRMKKQRVDSYIAFTQTFENLRQCITLLCDTLDKKPVEVKDPSETMQFLYAYDSILVCRDETASIAAAISKCPKQVNIPSGIESYMTGYDALRSLSVAIRTIEDFYDSKPVPVQNVSLEKEFQLLKHLEDMFVCIGGIENEYQVWANSVAKQSELSAQLDIMRSEYGVCPTCGRLLEETHI